MRLGFEADIGRLHEILQSLYDFQDVLCYRLMNRLMAAEESFDLLSGRSADGAYTGVHEALRASVEAYMGEAGNLRLFAETLGRVVTLYDSLDSDLTLAYVNLGSLSSGFASDLQSTSPARGEGCFYYYQNGITEGAQVARKLFDRMVEPL